MRGPWVKAVVGAAVAALFGGRWLALQTADRLWAESLGVADAHADIALLRLALTAGAFAVATAWYVGNLALLYRQIGAVQVPRQVGDLEIVEHLPRRYLLVGVIVAGLVLAAVSCHGAGDWWMARALSRADLDVGPPDPILGRPTGYYLFALPWERALQHFALRLTTVGGLLLAVLYAAVGAIRREERRLVFLPFARWHLAALSGTLAVVLAWGFVLEPAALVAGMGDVPFDAVLRDVRIPVATVLAVLALVAATASLVWLRVDRFRVPAIAWLALLGTGFLGRFMLPGIVRAGRAGDQGGGPEMTAAVALARHDGFQLSVDTVKLPLAVPDAEYAVHHAADLAEAPVWDASFLTVVLNRIARHGVDGRFFNASLVSLPRTGAPPVTIFLAVREPEEPESGRRTTEGPGARGAVAVLAARVGPHGRPLFLESLDDSGAVGVEPEDLPLRDGDTWFATGATGHVVTVGEAGPTGILVRGWWRRLALAWALQYPGLLSRRRVPSGSVIVTERSVAGRLARYAPFARFGPAWPVVLEGRLVWAAWGYVAAAGFPAAPAVEWRGERVRYLRAGFLGTVDAASGVTQVYLAPKADPLSRAWQGLLPDVVLSAQRMPADLDGRLRYPEELFRAQLQVLTAAERARPAEPYWWVGSAPGDTVVRLRLRAVDEVRVVRFEPRVAAVVEGVLEEEVPRVRVLRYPEPYTLAGPSELDSVFANAAPGELSTPGQMRLVPYEDGALAQQSFYTDSGTFVATVVGWRGVVGTGATVLDALRHLTVRPDTAALAGVTSYEAARAWFRRLDQAREAGDWEAFGEAWEGLRESLGVPRTERQVVPNPRRN